MTAPLYANCEKPAKCDGNLGLWFERFFDQYDPRNWEVLKPTTNNNQMGNAYWLLRNFANKKAGDDKQLAAHAQTQMQLATSLQGQNHVFKASWHFVTGMGNPHPVENGFAWHPTLGVPYLTGAAVKGLVRSYIENHLDDTPENRQQLLLDWFGSTDKDPLSQGYQSQAGNLIFFDALPIKPVTLGVDIMTPHMGKWYEKGGTDQAIGTAEAVPADWHDPVPVSFLVAKDITLLFSFAVRQYPTNADSKRPAIDLADVADVLQRALEQAGAGGKTATGYGGLLPDEKENQKAALVGLSDEELYRVEIKQIDDKKLAEMLGKNFNKTKETKADSWSRWLEVVIEEKRPLIESWASAAKNSAEEKAYKNLKNKTDYLS